MELLQLRYFLETAKNQSFTKTAEKYGVPTTSVSASIKRLEKELGVKLFTRSANKIFLNQKGERLKKAVTFAFSEIDEAVYEISENYEIRQIKLLVKSSRSDVTDFIIKYNKIYPQTVFKTVFDFTENNYDKYDVIIDGDSDLYKGYKSFELFSMQIKLKVCKDKHISNPIKLKDLEKQNFISWGENSNMHKTLIKACERAGFYPNISVQSNDKECYEKLVKAGVGIGLLRQHKNKENDDLKELNVSDFNERYTVYCYYNPTTCLGSVKKFIEFIKNEKSDF